MLAFQLGERWEYGKSADVLGGVIEVASRVPLGEFFKKEILEPLDMQDTGFIIPKENIPRIAKIGMPGNEGLQEITAQMFYGDNLELYKAPYIEKLKTRAAG